jgi:hypothetical protein
MAQSVAVWAVDTNTRIDGYHGIWFNLGQSNDYGPKYSGGLATYTANHVPIAIYRAEVNKTFFVYGGMDEESGDLLIMASYYDHATCQVPRPTVVYHKVGVNDPHDNGALLIDRDGYLWVFISGRGRGRTGWLFRGTAPYSVDAFEWIKGGTGDNFFEKTYPQPWYMDNGVDQPVFMYMFTKYTDGRELYWATSTDGVNWSEDHKMAGMGGHYQTSCRWHNRIGTAFNYHPGGSVDKRTNLYYLQTDDIGTTWTKADGTLVSVPLTTPANDALVVDYEAQGLLCYINDTNFDAQGRPYIIYETSTYYGAGPDGYPRVWHLARWDGTQWIITDITQSDHNYDMGSLWVEGNLLRIIAPTEDGPQLWGAGGEVAVWTSADLGATWHKERDVTQDSIYNHTYVRRPLDGRDPFFAMWADGDSFVQSESRLYFCNRTGTHVWQLPTRMSGDFARPTRVTDFTRSAENSLWRSPFESLAAGTVAAGDVIDKVRNAVGEQGTAVGETDLTYAQYGQAGAGTAPSVGAGSFAASFPDDRTVAIDTNVLSNAGNLQSTLTAEGFFRTPSATLITSPTYVGRRLFSQKRSSSDGESRLAIGLHGTTLPGTGDYLDYEGFDYTGTTLEGQAGGSGFGGAWTNATTCACLSNDGTSLTSSAFPFTPVGARISGAGGTCARLLSHPIDMASDGNVAYVSALLRKTTIDSASAENLEVGFASTATASATGAPIRIGMTSTDAFFLTSSSNTTGTVAANTTYFVLAKIVSSASGSDVCYMNVYGPNDTVPPSEPSSWSLSHQFSSSTTLSYLRLTIGSSLDNGEIDEVRVGSSYAAVTDSDAILGTAGGPANVLSVFWHDTDAVNHLETGVTPILPDTWYHFALVFDGASIKWYLNGALEGSVVASNLCAAGSATLTIGNNRASSTTDRGFYGLVDEVRVTDQALEPSSFAINTGSCEAACGTGASSSVVWCSGFEAKAGASVTHGQVQPAICGAVENTSGTNGTSVGTTNPSYVGYGQTGVGTAPAGAGSYAMAFPNDRAAAIETCLRSNSGNLDNALTFEGFFNTSEASLITSPDNVGRRFVTQKRDSDTDTRLAIGLHSNGGANVLATVYKSSDGATRLVTGSTPIQAGAWHHFALVYDGTGLVAYLDGAVEASVPSANLIDAGTGFMTIANRRSDGVADRGFYGMLDEIRITDGTLSPSDFLIGQQTPDEPCWLTCPLPFADADVDGDVDQVDFAVFQTCLSGDQSLDLFDPGLCHCFDRDGSDTIDADDLNAFLDCVTGPSIPWTTGLAPSCIP